MTGDIGVMILAILPEIGLIVLAGLILVLDLTWRDPRTRKLGWFTASGLGVLIVFSLIFSRPPAEGLLIWGGMLRFDSAGFVFRMVFLAGAALTALIAMETEVLSDRGEFYALMVTSTLGMCLMSSAADIIMIYLAMETTSIPLYILAGFRIRDQKSTEAGIKYLLYGGMASTILLYGFALLYGFTGVTQLSELAAKLSSGTVPFFTVIMSFIMVLVGFGFKISAVPFHFWAPDVYEGAPTPVAGFLSTASKAAGFAVLLRMFSAFPEFAPTWTVIIAVMATASMVVGNFLALTQKNVKRLLAYSSIAQAGYILIGVAANSELGTTGVVYYLMAYLLTNITAFGIVAMVNRSVGSNDLSAFAGLSRRSPGIALAFLVALLSLGGIPPFAGFIGKLLVFGAAIQSGLLWLAIVGILNSVVSLYYYLTILKVMYLYRSEDENKPLFIASSRRLALILGVFGIVLLGIVISPWFLWASQASVAFLGY